jgi:single-strand DNA-binding protein
MFFIYFKCRVVIERSMVIMNRVTLMGRLTKEPELRYTNTSGKAISNFTIAVERKFGKSDGEKITDFLPIVSWEKLAEFSSEYFKKGMRVVVVGRVQVRTWDDENNIRHYMTEIVADELFFADSKKSYGENNITNSGEELASVEGF